MKQRGSLYDLVLAVAAAAVVTFAGAQEPVNTSSAGDEAIGTVFEAMQAAFAPRASNELAGATLLALAEGLAVLTGSDFVEREYPRDFQVCAHLVGTGGHTRIDGGGELLAVLPDFLAANPRSVVGRTDHRIQQARLADHDVVVLDEFNLASLFVSLSVRLREGAVVVDPSEGFDDLWRALVGYLVESDVEFEDELVLRHGHLVAFHALAQLPRQSRISGVEFRRPDHLVLHVDTHAPDGHEFEVHLVDVDFDDSASLQAAVQEAPRLGTQPHRAVVLSWGLVDCTLGEAYEAYEADVQAPGSEVYGTLVDYMQAALERSSTFDDLIAKLCSAFQGPIVQALERAVDCADPDDLAWLGSVAVIADVSARALQAFEPSTVNGTTYFAAAGNQGLGFPMPPAAWPAVIGVEACLFGEAGRSAFSNAGSTGVEGSVAGRALGAWFAVDAWVRHPTASNFVAQLGYWGTSFAAPTAAMSFAVGAASIDASVPLAPCAPGTP